MLLPWPAKESQLKKDRATGVVVLHEDLENVLLLGQEEKSTINKKKLECQRLKAIQQLLVYSASMRKAPNIQTELWFNYKMSPSMVTCSSTCSPTGGPVLEGSRTLQKWSLPGGNAPLRVGLVIFKT